MNEINNVSFHVIYVGLINLIWHSITRSIFRNVNLRSKYDICEGLDWRVWMTYLQIGDLIKIRSFFVLQQRERIF